jgi:glycosyltransferase involved in cell wall biosynthesis
MQFSNRTLLNNNILFVSFQGISKGIPNGMVKSILQIINGFDNTTKNSFLYIVSQVDGYRGDVSIRQLSAFYLFIKRAVNYLNKFIGIPYHYIRYWNERAFDFFLCLRLKEPTIIISSAYLLKSLKKNKLLGGMNILLAGNPDDYEIYSLLKSEQNKHNILFADAYTYRKRIDFVAESTSSYDHIITFSTITFESYSKRITKDNISSIPSYIIPNPQTFQKQSIEKNKLLTFCFVAHPFWLKGLPYLLEAWHSLKPTSCELVIGGRLDNQLKTYIDQHYNKLQNVKYLGWVKDLNKFFRSSHVCIVPSLIDAGPATVAEAMYCGLPVIVSEGCGSRTLIKDGENGFVVASGSSQSIAHKIRWFIENPDQIETMGRNTTNKIIELERSKQNNKVAEHILKVINSLEDKRDGNFI